MNVAVTERDGLPDSTATNGSRQCQLHTYLWRCMLDSNKPAMCVEDVPVLRANSEDWKLAKPDLWTEAFMLHRFLFFHFTHIFDLGDEMKSFSSNIKQQSFFLMGSFLLCSQLNFIKYKISSSLLDKSVFHTHFPLGPCNSKIFTPNKCTHLFSYNHLSSRAHIVQFLAST